MAALTVIRPGMLTTIQDLGRWGLQASGVPVAGPMDRYSHLLANLLVGNEPPAASLEVTLMGPELEADADVECVVTGASFAMTAGERVVSMHTPFVLRAGERLRFGTRNRGARATLAIRGGVAVEPLFGSRATSLISRMGPFGGRALQRGDVLNIGNELRTARPTSVSALAPLNLPEGGAALRVTAGPQEHMFTRSAYDTLFGERFTITPASNRMGYRLSGATLQHAGSADILSDATPIGTLQVPASGQPILLMADRQTTGGYPKIATVISADLPVAGQLAPGDWIEFRRCTRTEAIAAARARFAAVEPGGR
ncbi:MAG TPA: biotin-dependent carboxyltransferase family protein [Vicinamibacterales bacterium]|nr:biotin-dependent carboxyltransferase family protein [Vicinamibacterales bacterium]